MTCRKPVVYAFSILFFIAVIVTVVMAAMRKPWDLAAPIAGFLGVLTIGVAASGRTEYTVPMSGVALE